MDRCIPKRARLTIIAGESANSLSPSLSLVSLVLGLFVLAAPKEGTAISISGGAVNHKRNGAAPDVVKNEIASQRSSSTHRPRPLSRSSGIRGMCSIC